MSEDESYSKSEAQGVREPGCARARAREKARTSESGDDGEQLEPRGLLARVLVVVLAGLPSSLASASASASAGAKTAVSRSSREHFSLPASVRAHRAALLVSENEDERETEGEREREDERETEGDRGRG